ncbi:MAG: tetraacyldisaccharide 4'-kinase [Flavobacteriales bacterium]|nr:tetraacyldisaccharide 4'-kinase [Flavobacteriales bacterium]
MQLLRLLLFPFSLIYGTAVWLRNVLFDKNILPSRKSPIPTIVIGNLSVGGTGKTPMALWVAQKLGTGVALLSRGYGRKSKGYLEVLPKSSFEECGDEPVLLSNRLPDHRVFVCEDRVLGTHNISLDAPETGRILLDDAFQHRRLAPDLSILLTTWDHPYSSDWILPTGNLRDNRMSARRANAVVVTKCPSHLPNGAPEQWRRKLNLHSSQVLAFTCLDYQDAQLALDSGKPLSKKVVLVSGIANPKLFEAYCSKHFEVLNHFKFPDHHAFKVSEIEQMLTSIGNFGDCNTLVTTEKDYVRLKEHFSRLMDINIVYIPIDIRFLWGEEELLDLITRENTTT